VPIVQGLSIVAEVVENAYLESRIVKMRDGIERGESILRTAVATGVFSPVVLQMVAVGEETGEIDQLMSEIADMYEREVAIEVEGLSAKAEPILLVCMGVLVLILALGVFLPMWDMASLQGEAVVPNERGFPLLELVNRHRHCQRARGDRDRPAAEAALRSRAGHAREHRRCNAQRPLHRFRRRRGPRPDRAHRYRRRQHPMLRLGGTPAGYAGEFLWPRPRGVAPGTWYFDTRERAIVYIVRFRSDS